MITDGTKQYELSKDQISFWQRNGYIVIKDLFTPQEKQEALTSANEISSWPEEKGKYMHYYEQMKLNGSRILCRTENFTPYHSGIKGLISTQKMQTVLVSLLKHEGTQDSNCQRVHLFKEKINYKLPNGGGFPAHQDAPAFFHLGEPMHISLMIAIDAATEHNGCLEVVPGSHTIGLIPQAKDGSIKPEWSHDKEWTKVCCEPGDCLFFGAYIAHKSGPNNSKGSRRAYYFTFNDSRGGDLRDDYYAEKRVKFPPPKDRVEGVDYSEGAKIYNLATPIEN